MNDDADLPEEKEFENEDLDQKFLPIEWLRDEALTLFDRFIAHRGAEQRQLTVSESLEERQQFLTLEETENIVREHAISGPGVYAIGGDTKEEVVAKIKVVMAALMHRVMSNVLRVGADMGLIDVMFDSERNDFGFSVSEKGKKVYDRVKAKLENGEEVDLKSLADDED